MIPAKIARLDASENRVAARRLVNFGARVGSKRAGGSGEVIVVELSPAGCKILCRCAPEEGEALWLKLPGCEARRVSVIWSRGAEAGCEFATPFSEPEMEAMRALAARPRGARRSSFGLRA